MKKIISLLILFCLLISCERKDPNFSEEMIEKLVYQGGNKNGFAIPTPYNSFDLYIRAYNNEIFVTNSSYLYESYKSYYISKFKSFKEFLEVVLDENYVFVKTNPKIMLARYFELNQKIEKEYSTLGFDKFLKKYSERSNTENQIELKKSIIQSEEYATIRYLLYLNRYDVSFDDIHVRYSIIKREDSFK